jgi:hypothetical protein
LIYTIIQNGDVMKTGVFPEGKRFVAYVNDEIVSTSYNFRTAEIAIEKATGIFVDRRGKRSQVHSMLNPNIESKFHINERFSFLEKAVQMVADKVQPSVVVSGAGGLGKTYTVRQALQHSGLEDFTLNTEEGTEIDRSNSFVFIKGFSTPKALYRSLYANNNSVIVYDDCDSILGNDVALNILKAGLDSYDKRVISWGAENRGKDDDLPQQFEFTGQIIFITNLPADDIDQSIRSRSLMVDVSMTTQETVDRMGEIIRKRSFLPEYSMEIKNDSLAFIDLYKDSAKELSLRTLITICKIRSEFGDQDWMRMAEYITCV